MSRGKNEYTTQQQYHVALMCIVSVVLDLCCVFQTAFRYLQHLKDGQTTFYQPFQTFFVHFKPFSVAGQTGRCRGGGAWFVWHGWCMVWRVGSGISMLLDI